MILVFLIVWKQSPNCRGLVIISRYILVQIHLRLAPLTLHNHGLLYCWLLHRWVLGWIWNPPYILVWRSFNTVVNLVLLSLKHFIQNGGVLCSILPLLLNDHPVVLFYIFHDLSLDLFILVEEISKLFGFSSLVHASRQRVIICKTILDLNWALGILKRIVGVESVPIWIQSLHVILVKFVGLVSCLSRGIQRMHRGHCIVASGQMLRRLYWFHILGWLTSTLNFHF